MKTAISIWANDFRNIVRDRTVNFLLVVPLVFVAFFRFGVPLAELRVHFLGEYRPLVAGLFCMIASMFPAFIMSFVMLDERDEGLFAVFRILPIAPLRFLLYRLGLVAGLAFVYPMIILVGSQLVPYSLSRMLVLSALCALLAPGATLIVVSVAGNKIEGLTIIKGLFPLIGIPLVGIVVQSWWTAAFAVLPAYWIYSAFAAPDGIALARAATGATVLDAFIFLVFYRRFRRRVIP